MYATNSKSLVRQLAARTQSLTGRVTPAGLRFVGDALGLSLMVAGCWMWDVRAGLIAAGVAVLLFVARCDDSK